MGEYVNSADAAQDKLLSMIHEQLRDFRNGGTQRICVLQCICNDAVCARERAAVLTHTLTHSPGWFLGVGIYYH